MITDWTDKDGLHTKPSPSSLDNWWEHTARYDQAKTVPKTQAYGSQGEDLVAIGAAIASMGGMRRPGGSSDEAWHAELGTYFYVMGKIARAGEAYRNGKLPSYDTLFDITVYSMIWRRIRETGRWG